MDHSDRSQGRFGRLPRLFRAVTSLAMVIGLIAVLAQLLVAAAPLWKGGPVEPTLLEVGRELMLSVPALFYVAGLYFARRAFQRIGVGDLFARSNGDGLLQLGRCLLIGSVWGLIVAGLEPYGAAQPIGMTLLQVNESTSQLVLAALGVALMMIGRLMSIAARLKAENDAFV